MPVSPPPPRASEVRRATARPRRSWSARYLRPAKAGRGAAAVSAGVASLVAAACFGWSLQAQAPDRPRRSSDSAGPPPRRRQRVLPHVSRRRPRKGRARARIDPRSARGRTSRSLGKGRSQAAGAADAAGGQTPAERRLVPGRRRLPRKLARSGGGCASQSRPDGDHPAADTHRVSQRGSRPPGGRRRRLVTPAGRRFQLRVRQRDGGRSVADAARPLPVGRGKDQPSRGGPSEPRAGRRNHPRACGSHPGGPHRRPSHRHARRHRPRVHLPAGRRVRIPDPPDAGSRRARRRVERASRGRAAPRSRSRAGLHRETAAGRGHPRNGRSTPEGAGGGPRRAACHRRRIRQEAIAARGRVAPAVSGALQFLPASAHPAGDLLGVDHRTVRRGRRRGHDQPAPHLRVAAVGDR